ncbi:hypothetical protein B0H14DRAFT_3470470 [Mycena olivaceomarginata]|nr:hypothetical protein B0H14DRAFT_3470470 [Mycena olivaceomarginata]
MNRGVMHASDDKLSASFLLTPIMSKGQAWLADTVAQLSITLRSTVHGEPVALAGNAVRRYAGRTLKAQRPRRRLAAHSDMYFPLPIAPPIVNNNNPTQTDRAHLRLHYFARDERVFTVFAERLERIRNSTFVGRRLRAQLGVLRACLEGRVTTYRSKVIAVDRELSRLCGT